MNKQQGMAIIEGLRKAQAAGAGVVELNGDDARNFNWVAVRVREELLGSFCVEIGRKFFALVASTPRSTEDFQFIVYEKFKGSPILTTKSASTDGLVWTYTPTKQDAHNEARKDVFLEAAKAKSLTIPLPQQDLDGFSAGVNRAIDLRRLADAAGGTGGDQEDDEDDGGEVADPASLLAHLYEPSADRQAAATLLATAIRVAHGVNPKSWCVSNPGGAEKIRLNVGAVRVLDLRPGSVRLAVDGTKLDASVRASLGASIDLSDAQRLAAFGDNGIVDVSASAIGALRDEVRVAHEALVKRAATTASPFARFHQPSIVDAVATLLGEQLPIPSSSQARYWKVSPGEKGEMWEECRDGKFIAMGWDKLGDLSAVDHAEFKRRAEDLDASDQVWKFRNIEVGDRIVANDGISRVLGIGTVTGPYYYAEGKKRAHRLPVRWDDTNERSVEMKGWRKTLIRLNHDTFTQLEAAPIVGEAPPPDEEAGPEGGIDFEGILSQLSSRSLSFSAELVASYLLALQAKRFVLLTGISGTGKTRLAQEVARVFGPTAAQAPVVDADAFEIVAKPYQLKYARFIVPSLLAQEFDALANPETKRLDLKLPGLPLASMALYKNAERGNLFYVLLSGEAKAWFNANIKLGDRFLLTRQTSGDHEWIDLALTGSGQRSASTDGGTYELIAVRPDWTDSRELLGFYNPLTKTYLSKPTLQLLLRAVAEVAASTDKAPPRPYFLIFDEMNLARVEHYFSDFLSAMESGEAIHLHDDPQLEEEEGIPRRIAIPKNVFVIGTVNVDETTYMFSPKVLDRAFVLEFNDVNFDGLGGAIEAEEPESTPLALTRLEGGLKLRGPATDAEWQRFEKILNGEANTLLRKLHEALSLDNRHFGYRVAREVARFVDLAMEQTDGAPTAARAAIDVAVLAKILPKLHGSQAEVESILKRLTSIAIGDRQEADVFSAEGAILEGLAAGLPLPRTARKLWRMQRRLRAHGFVSFIE